MDEELFYKRYEHSAKTRGAILEATVELERLIDDFLSIYFCNDNNRGNQLKEMLWATERITLGSKKDILFMVLNLHYKSFLIDNPQFISRMELVIPHRNIFAHLEIDRNYDSDINTPYQIIFKKYKNGQLKLIKYGSTEIASLSIEFNYLIECLKILLTTKLYKFDRWSLTVIICTPLSVSPPTTKLYLLRQSLLPKLQ